MNWCCIEQGLMLTCSDDQKRLMMVINGIMFKLADNLHQASEAFAPNARFFRGTAGVLQTAPFQSHAIGRIDGKSESIGTTIQPH